MSFADKMKLLIANEGLTQVKFAEEIGMFYPHANKFFTGRKPNIDFISKVKKRFPDVNLNWLLTDAKGPQKVNAVMEPTPNYAPKTAKYIKDLEKTISLLKKEMS